MSWFDAAGFANLAKSAINTAQKTIDKALDIQEGENQRIHAPEHRQHDDEAFFAAFGIGKKLTGSPSKKPDGKPFRTTVPILKNVTDSWSRDGSGFWSDWGSYFEINKPPSQDDKSAPVPTTTSPAAAGESSDQKTELDSASASTSEGTSKPSSSSPSKAVLLQPQSSKLFPTQSTSASSETVDSTKAKTIQSASASEVSQNSKSNPDLEDSGVPEDDGEVLHHSLSKSEDADTLTRISNETNVAENTQDEDAPKESDASESGAVSEPVTKQPKPVSPPSPSLENVDVDYSIIYHSDNTKASSSESTTIQAGSGTTLGEESFETLAPSSEESQISDELMQSGNQDSLELLNQSSETLYAGETGHNQGEISSPSDSIVPVFEDDTQSSASNSEEARDKDDKALASSISNSSHISLNFLHEAKDTESEYSSSLSPADDCDLVKLCKEGFETLQSEELTECRGLVDCDDAKSVDRMSQQTSSSGSFVQCSVEDADMISHSCQSPNSTTPSERSDNLRPCSEQNSGHTSDDEIETTTSSDIEIISSPAGENGSERHVSSPMKHYWAPRIHRTHYSDSPASEASSKEGVLPVVREVEEGTNEQSRTKGRGSLGGSKLLGRHHRDSPQIEKLLKKLEETQEILEARERKVLELCKENGELQETNSALRNQIQQLEEAHVKESQGVSSLTQEFTQRLAMLESKLQETCRERDMAKKQLVVAKEEAASRLSASEMEFIIKEKEQQISELMEEGEKLSKQQLHQSNIIKKLRAKEKEMESLIKSQKEKLEEQSRDLDRISRSLNAKDEQEKKHIDAIRQLTTSVQQQEKEIINLKSDTEDARERAESLKRALDGAYKQITELQRANQEKENQAQESMLSAEMAAQEKLQQAMQQEREKAEHEKGILLAQIEDLRASMTATEQQAERRERVLRKDIADLQQRLQIAEARNEELSQSMSIATRPLLRQIENLQSTFNAQAASWERVERSLSERLNETQTQLTLSLEREKIAVDKCAEVKSKLVSAETEIEVLKQEQLQLLQELEIVKQKLDYAEDNRNSKSNFFEEMKQRYEEDIKELKIQNEQLRIQLQNEQEHNELEKKKTQQLHEELREKERRFILGDTGSHRSATPSPPMSRISSVSETHWNQEDFMDQSMTMSTISASAGFGRMSVYDSLRIGNAATLVENLQAQLKQRDGEINQLHSEIAQLERTRESMTQELVLITEKSGQLELRLAELEHLDKSFKDMEQKYNTLLQMYGEKVEEAEELRLDLQDVKSMYRAQLDELTRMKS